MRGIWRCFTRCGGGDTVELVRQIEKCSYVEAARRLNRLASNETPLGYNSAAPNGSHIESSFKPFIRSIPLDPEVPFLQEIKGISPFTARRFEAGTSSHSTFLANCAAVRLHDMDGSPLGYCGRRLDPILMKRFGKWRFPKNFPKGSMLYNAHRARPFLKKSIIVVECPWAVMRLSQAGFPNIVALLGTLPSKTQLDWLSNAPAILLLLDGDHAGDKAARKIRTSLSPSTYIYTHRLPEGMEPEDLSDKDLASTILRYPIFS